MDKKFRIICDSSEVCSIEEYGTEGPIIMFQNNKIENEVANKYCIYDIDSVVQRIIYGYGEAAFFKIDNSKLNITLHKVIGVESLVDKYSVLSFSYIFDNNKRIDIDLSSITEDFEDAKTLSLILTDAAVYIRYVEDHIPSNCIFFDYEHWG